MQTFGHSSQKYPLARRDWLSTGLNWTLGQTIIRLSVGVLLERRRHG